MFIPGPHRRIRAAARSLSAVGRVSLGLLLVCGLARDLGGQRRTIGLALGGGSARGFAHVGVLRWLEEHHIPIDAIAGTSMGGLVGGSYAAGMSPGTLQTLLDTADWDELFGATAYRYKTVRRKEDARAYPSRLEFHIRRGFAMPTALNNGQQIDLLLSRLGAAYGGMSTFDSLPTRFRCVTLDIRTGEAVVLDRGSLATAMRATMSLPGVFPPVQVDEHMLVDGGPMDNVPADIARAMGVDVVIAVDVSSAKDTTDLEYSVFGLVGAVSDALIRANTERGMAAANLVIHPDLSGFSSLDWRRAPGLIAAGYAAADAMRDQLLPLGVDDSTWRAYVARRAARRLDLPTVASIATEGMTRDDARRVTRLLARYVNKRADPAAFDHAVLHLSGMDRYLSVAWELRRSDGRAVLVVRARARNTAPPILMTTINAENRTSDDFLFQIAARMLAYDVGGAGNELRLDGVVGTDPSVAAELLHPFVSSGSTTLFLAGAAAWGSRRFDMTHDDAVVARYIQRRVYAQGELGFERAEMEIRAGARVASLASSVKVGNPGLPSISGTETELHLRGVFDSQNSATIPSEGLRVVAWARHLLDAPEPSDTPGVRSNRSLTQAELATSSVWSWRQRAERVFVAGFAGTSFNGAPLFTDQFTLGLPLRLDAFEVGERRGDHYGVLTAGYLHAFARLPDVLGGSIIGGAWLQTGSAFDEWSQASVGAQGAVGAILETLIGPAVVRFSAGAGARRFAIGFGRLF